MTADPMALIRAYIRARLLRASRVEVEIELITEFATYDHGRLVRLLAAETISHANEERK